IHVIRYRPSRRRNSNELAPMTAASASQAAGVRRSHGAVIKAAIAVNPASTRSTRFHLFCHNGQRTKNGATNNSCPLNIAPAANRQPHKNQRFFRAASAANRKNGRIQASHCGQPCASRIMDGSSHATLAAVRPKIQARSSRDKLRSKVDCVVPDRRRTHEWTRRKIATAESSSHNRLIFSNGLTSFGCPLSTPGNWLRTSLAQIATTKSRSGG